MEKISNKMRAFWTALGTVLCVSGAASGAGLDLQFVGGTNVMTGGTCAMTANSRCRFNNVVVGANGTPLQRDIVVTITGLVNGATVVGALDDSTPTFSDGTPTASGTQLFAPTIRLNNTGTFGWAEFTFDVLPAGGTVPPVGGGTASLPGTVWVTSLDTDGDGNTTYPIYEIVGFVNPVVTDKGSNLSTSSNPSGATSFRGPTTVRSGISVLDEYKASAVYESPSSFKIKYGGYRSSYSSTGDASLNRLTALDFFRPDALATQPIVEGYKSVRLTDDADNTGTITKGDTVTYSVVYVNTGNAPATGVQINDVLPTGLVLTSTGAQQVYLGRALTNAARNTSYTGTSAASALLASGQTIAPNSTIRVDIPAKVTQATAATLSNQATATMTMAPGSTIVSASEALDSTSVVAPSVSSALGWFVPPSGSVPQTPAANQNPTLLAVVAPPAPQLSLAKTHSGNFTANQSGTYTLTITNSGQVATSGAITIKDALPSGMQFVSASSSQGAISGAPASGTTGTVGFTFTPAVALAAGGSATVTVGVLPLEGGTFTNYASVEGGGDPDAGLTPGSACTTEQCDSDPTRILVPSGPAVPQGIWSKSDCLDFTGVALRVNATTTLEPLTTPEGVVVNATLTVTSNAKNATGGPVGASENVLRGYVPGTYTGDQWDKYFGAGKTNAVSNNPVGRRVGFILKAYATYNGQAVPFTVLTGSAEDDGAGEYVQVTSNGTPFAVAERKVPNSSPGTLEVSGGGQTVKMSVRSGSGNFLLVATSKADASAADPLVLTSEIAGDGATAQGYCVAFPFDRGDAPTSYGKASHLQNLTFTSSLNNTGLTSLNADAFAVSPSTSRTTSVLNGQPDSELTEKGTTATGDTDDALLSAPTLGLGATSYTLSVPYTSSVPATVAGWVDFNGNGVFDAPERASVGVPAGVGQATLTWAGISATASGATTYARLRIGSNAAEVSSPTGSSINGEVEDYAVNMLRTGKITIIKVASPKNAQDFAFTTTGTGLSSFAVDDDSDPTLSNTKAFSALAPGAYSVTETALPGWNLTGLTCNSGAGVTTDLPGRTVAVNLVGGTDITCTYTNTMQSPSVTLKKYVRDATRNTAFTGTTLQALPGTKLQYCITFVNSGGDALKFNLHDVVPGNTTYAGNLIYAAPARELQGTDASPATQTLPANASLSKVDAPAPSTAKSVVFNMNADGRAANPTGLPAGGSGVVCFDATIN